MNKTTVLIIDDHAILRMGLASLLNAKGGIEVVGDAANGKTGIAKALRLRPDVVIMDLMMPGMDGAETTRQLLAKAPESHVLILTTFGTSDGISHALEAGALGAVMKNCDFSELVTALRTVARGEKYLSPEIRRIISKDPPIAPLSPRHLAPLFPEGRTSRVLWELDITTDTLFNRRRQSVEMIADTTIP